jgi:arabinose-5-phosphate isomerase
MHAADAIHGDLGMIQQNDLVICISKSGNTPEIKVLVPLLKRRGSKLVALVSNTQSYLAEQADFVLNATIGEEACPNNLAPTTSTTAHLAMGDALAVCLVELRNFSDQDFAMLHPGGALGKQLYLKVSDIYSARQLPLVKPDASLSDVILEISSKRLGCTAVVQEDQTLLGIITDGDLRRMLQKNPNLNGITAADIMSKNPKRIGKDEFAVKALHLMQESSITQLVVVDDERVAGFVHLHDLLKEGIV